MSDDLALNIPINADVNPLEQAMQKLKDSVGGATATIKDAMGAVGIMAAGYLKGAVDSAAKVQQSTLQLQNLLKNQGIAFQDTSKDINAFTSSITKMSTYSAGEAKAALTNLTERGVKYSDSLKSSTALANLAAGANMDLTSSSNLLAMAYNGRYMQLERLGIVTKEQVKNGMTYQQVLDAINKRFGGSASQQVNTYAGQIKILQNNLAAMKVAIGTALLPVLEKMMEAINKAITPLINFAKTHSQLTAAVLTATAAIGTLVGGMSLFSKISSFLGPAVEGITGTIASLSGPVVIVIAGIVALTAAYEKNFGGIKTIIDNTVTKVIDVLNNMGKGIQDLARTGDVGAKAMNGLEKALGFQNAHTLVYAMTMISDAIRVVVKVIKGDLNGAFAIMNNDTKNADSLFANVIKIIYNVSTQLRSLIGNIISTVSQALPKIISIFKPLSDNFNTILKSVEKVFPTIETIVEGVFEDIKNTMNTVGAPAFKLLITITSDVINKISGLFPTIADIISTTLNTIKTLFTTVVQPLFNILLEVLKVVIDWVKQNWPAISTVIYTVFNAIKQAWEQILKPALQFIVQQMQQIVQWVQQNWPLIKQTIITVLNDIKTGIQVAMEVIKPIWQAAWDIISSIVPPIWETIKAVVSTGIKVIEDVIKTVMDIINGNWGSAWKDLVNLVKDIFGGAVNIVKGILDTIGGLFKGIAKTALDWGKDLVGGIIDGIKSKVDDVGKAASDVASKIKSFLHFSVPDEGPLTEYGQWMPDFMQGLADGISNNMDVIDNALIKVSTALANAVNPERSTRASIFNQLASGATTVDAALQQLSHTNDMLSESTGDSTEDLRNMLGEMTNISTESVVAWNAYKKLSAQLGENDEKTQEMLSKYNDYQKQYADMAEKVVEAQQKINDAQQKTTDTFISNVNNLADKLKDALKQNYDYEKSLDEKSVTDYRDAQLAKIDSQIDALDKQQQAHDEAEEDADNTQKENDIRRQLAMSVGKAKRAELQSQLNDLLKEDDDRHYKESIDAQKDALQQQETQIKDSADAKLQNIDAFYSQQTTDAQLSAQAQKMIIDNNQKDIITLLQKYGDDYEITGQSIGERFANAFSSSIDTINNNFFTPLYAKLSSLQNIMGNITSGNINVNQQTITNASFSRGAIDAMKTSLTTRQPNLNVTVISQLDGKAVAKGITQPLDITQGNNLALRSRRVGVT